jgi:serine O-acetyltransferase
MSPRIPAGADLPIDSGILEQTIAHLSGAEEGALAKAASEGVPDRAQVTDWVERTKRLLLMRPERSALRSELPHLAERLRELLDAVALPDGAYPRELVEQFLPRLPAVRSLLAQDVEAAYEGDPAARSFAEIVAAYPAIRAIAIHRIAHELQLLRIPILPRMMAEHAHDRTGIDIHPGARIGRRFFIDHGTGVVIGETTEIGDRVRIYQGVTLGARSPRHGESLRGRKRHPTIEDDVTLYAGATILGGETTIGRGSVIGGNVWLTESIPPDSKVVAQAARPQVRRRGSGSPPDQLGWDI